MSSPLADDATPRTCLDVRGVGKRFGPTVALEDVSFGVLRGEVHALVGHNGSGKSTLVKLISGLFPPDAGTVLVNGVRGESARLGIVHQDLALCGDATVLENCCMGSYHARRAGMINWALEERVVRPILESLAAGFSLDVLVSKLSPAEQAIVAIARALRGLPGRPGLDLLVLDEATARLRGRDADKVLATARLVAGQGGGVLLVTHHMTEVLQAAERATVLSSGRVAGTVDVASTTEDDLLEMGSGRRMPQRRGRTIRANNQAEAAFVAESVTGEWATRICLTAHAGEILGLTGAAGAGHEEMPYLLAGAKRRRQGQVFVYGKQMRAQGVSESRRYGVGLVPADRLNQGVLTAGSIRENLSPLVRRKHTRMRFSASRRERRWAREVCTTFEVRPPDSEALMSTLSGGNQQKVLLARVLEDHPKVLVLHEPTQGVDEGTRRSLIELVRQTAAGGTAVLYVSSDIEEVAGCSDRVLVFRRGQIVAESDGGLTHIDEIYSACYLTAPASNPDDGIGTTK
jgi:ribose transport system ATP-binding protein